MRLANRFVLAALFTSSFALSDPVIHSFEVWGDRTSFHHKVALYIGWTNGYLAGVRSYATPEQNKRLEEFYRCLEKMSYPQALAMVDRYYKDHPELWKNPLPEMLINAVTIPGGPCEGKGPVSK